MQEVLRAYGTSDLAPPRSEASSQADQALYRCGC